MDRAIPTVNKILNQKWRDIDLRLHKEKLKKVEPGIEKVRELKKIKIRSNKNFRQEGKR